MPFTTSNLLSTIPPYYNFPSNSIISLVNAIDGGITKGANYFSAGMTSIVGLMNQNSAMIDIGTRYGAGNWGVADGLVVSFVSNYISISQGQIIMDGVLEYEGGSFPIPVTDSYLYLDDNANLLMIPKISPLTKPPYVYLGEIIVSTGNPTYDNSGVPYIVGGLLRIYSGDPFLPSANLPSNSTALVTTLGGIFLWNGTKYLPIGDTIITWRMANTNSISQSSPIFSQINLTANTVVVGNLSTNSSISLNFNVVSKIQGVIGNLSVLSTGAVSLTMKSYPTTLAFGDVTYIQPLAPTDTTWQNLEVFVYALP